jgi:segregation and condensation protein B
LIVSESGLSREEMKKAIGDVEIKEIDECLEALKKEYEGEERAFNIAEIAGRCRIVTKSEYMPWVGKLYEIEPNRLSGPSLETIAIIAYKQPVTRAEVEVVRGVNSGGVIRTLVEKELVLVKGRKDCIGKPLLYATTDKFLELFGLNSIKDLPLLRDFSEEDLDFGKSDEKNIVELDEPGQNQEAEDETEESQESS